MQRTRRVRQCVLWINKCSCTIAEMEEEEEFRQKADHRSLSFRVIKKSLNFIRILVLLTVCGSFDTVYCGKTTPSSVLMHVSARITSK